MRHNISLLVGFIPQTTDAQKMQLHNKLGARLIAKFKEINVEVVEVMSIDLQNIQNTIRDYQSSGHVAFIEDNIIYSKNNIQYSPFSKQYSRDFHDHINRQWGLGRVDFKPVWDAARHIKRKVTIAILDTGIDPGHPELSSKIIRPINFTTKNRKDFQDENGHGTHVAGITAAVTNNKIGSSRTRVNIANIMPIKVIGPNGGQSKWIIAGILYAVLNGAKVINISIGGPPFSKALQRAINYAWEKGVVIVAAAGNEGIEQVEFPAGYNFVLAVSAINEVNDRAKFSNWGINIGITAPGTSILSTTPTYPTPNRQPFYDSLHGTSQATPFVSGLAALLVAIYPELTNAEVMQIIQRAADPIHEEIKKWTPFFGYGLLNPRNTINLSLGKTITRSTKKKTPRGKISNRKSQVSKGSFYGQIVNQLENPIANAHVSARINGKIVSMYKTRNNVLTETGALDTDGMFRLQNLPPGKYSIFVELPGQPPIEMGIFTITSGADTILQLVCKT